MEEGIAEIIIAKNKSGSIGELLLEFQSEFMGFRDIKKDVYTE